MFATLLFAAGYAVLVPCLWLLALVLLTGSELFRLLLSVLLVPVLAALGFVALLRGLLPIGLLLGALAARMPDRRWPRLLAAAALPCIDLLLVRASGVPALLQRLLWLLMDAWTLPVLQFGAPVAASVLAAWMVPNRWLRRVLASGADRHPVAREGAR